VTSLIQRFHAARGHTLPLWIQSGMLADYRRLARFHYRPALPATCIRVLTLHAPDEADPIAVLTISMPGLNASWRALAWPGIFSGPDKRERAVRINAQLRTISRIVVDPRWRGMGAARFLVRAYLEQPLTPCTEALAAMGACCPFFTRAGMMPCPVPPSRHDDRLLAALRDARLQPWQLIDPRIQANLGHDSPLARRIRSWANASRAHRAIARGPIETLALRAAAALSGPRTAYFHGIPDPDLQPPPSPGALAPGKSGNHNVRSSPSASISR
jgi:GNAT superfamily N-acetyltransferase